MTVINQGDTSRREATIRFYDDGMIVKIKYFDCVKQIGAYTVFVDDYESEHWYQTDAIEAIFVADEGILNV